MFRKVFGNNKCIMLLIQRNVRLFVSVTQYSFKFRPVTLCNSTLQVCATETVLPCTSFESQSVARSHIQMHMWIGLRDGDFSATLWTNTGDSERWIYLLMLHVNMYSLCDLSEQIIFITVWCCWDGTRER
jgi:hypothetical protein